MNEQRTEEVAAAIAAGTYRIPDLDVADAILMRWRMDDLVTRFEEIQPTDSVEDSGSPSSC